MVPFKKILYWFLSCTWGLSLTLIGGITSFILWVVGHRVYRSGPVVYFKIRGLSYNLCLGPILILKDSYTVTEYSYQLGLSLQNIIWGPLYLFVVIIPKVLCRKISQQVGQTGRIQVSASFCSSAMALPSAICFIIFIFSKNWVSFSFGVILLLYGLILFIWSLKIEIPKYLYSQTGPVNLTRVEKTTIRLGDKFYLWLFRNF